MTRRDDRYYEAIAEGVHRAFWQLFSNASDMPCHDFYDTLKDAAREAFETVADRLLNEGVQK